MSKYWLGKTRSEETKAKISASRKGKLVGENHPHYGQPWAGRGEHHNRWTGGCWAYWRKKALERDDYTCQHCDLRDEEIIQVDHIQPLKGVSRHTIGDHNNLENLISLCPNCHARKSNKEKRCRG